MADSNKKNTEGGEKGKRSNEPIEKIFGGDDLDMDSLEAGSAGTSSIEQPTKAVPIDTPRPGSESDQPHENEPSGSTVSSKLKWFMTFCLNNFKQKLKIKKQNSALAVLLSTYPVLVHLRWILLEF